MIAKAGLAAIVVVGLTSPGMAYDAVFFQHEMVQRAHCLATTHSETSYESCVSGSPANLKAWTPIAQGGSPSRETSAGRGF